MEAHQTSMSTANVVDVNKVTKLLASLCLNPDPYPIHDHFSTIRTLLMLGADPSAPTDVADGRPVLFAIAEMESPIIDVVMMLLDAGVDVNGDFVSASSSSSNTNDTVSAPDELTTPLSRAMHHNNISLACLLACRGARASPLELYTLLSKACSRDAFCEPCFAGPDPSPPTAGGTGERDSRVVRALLARGASPNPPWCPRNLRQGQEGSTVDQAAGYTEDDLFFFSCVSSPLAEAASAWRPAVVSALLEAGACPTCTHAHPCPQKLRRGALQVPPFVAALTAGVREERRSPQMRPVEAKTRRGNRRGRALSFSDDSDIDAAAAGALSHLSLGAPAADPADTADSAADASDAPPDAPSDAEPARRPHGWEFRSQGGGVEPSSASTVSAGLLAGESDYDHAAEPASACSCPITSPNVPQIDVSALTPYACWCEHPQLATLRVLLAAGADPLARSPMGPGAVLLAVQTAGLASSETRPATGIIGVVIRAVMGEVDKAQEGASNDEAEIKTSTASSKPSRSQTGPNPQLRPRTRAEAIAEARASLSQALSYTLHQRRYRTAATLLAARADPAAVEEPHRRTVLMMAAAGELAGIGSSKFFGSGSGSGSGAGAGRGRDRGGNGGSYGGGASFAMKQGAEHLKKVISLVRDAFQEEERVGPWV